MAISAAEWAQIGAAIAEQARLARGLSPEQWAALPAQAREGYVRRWRIESLYWVLDERQAPPRKVKFRANHVQKRLMDRLWYWNVILKARQHGVSTWKTLHMLDGALFSENFRAGIIDRTDIEAKKKLAKIRFAYEHLDDSDDPRTAPLGAAIKRQFPMVAPSNDHTLTFANGSQIYAATSLRGGTINDLWISELGKIAMDDAKKAEEIMGGSLEAVHPGNIIVIESTHEGGRVGENYRMIRLAQKSPAPPYLSRMQYRFHFFAWWENPEYAEPVAPGRPLPIPPDLAKYFAGLEKECGISLTAEQKNWYLQKSATQRDMARQYPGTPEEALNALVEGAIYADIINRLRAQGRVCDLVCDPQAPLFTSWDLGESDASGVWLLQIIGPDIHALDFHCGNGMTPDQHAAAVLRWEKEYARPIAAHYLPHDAHQKKAGTTWATELKKAGLINIRVVPRIPDVWVGITKTRQLLVRFRFNARTCEKEFPQEGDRIWPSGMGALSGYRKKIVAETGTEKTVPVHNECESGACMAGDTWILCADGWRMIKFVPVGARVVTPDGAGLVTASGVVARRTRTLRIVFSNGEEVRCTPEHKFLTPKGLVPAERLRTFSEAWSQRTAPRMSFLTAFGISWRDATTWWPERKSYALARSILRCGFTIAERLSQATTFIIGTASRLTTASRILRWSKLEPTCDTMAANLGRSESRSASNVSAVGWSSGLKHTISDFAAGSANRGERRVLSLHSWKRSVSCAVGCLWTRLNDTMRAIAQQPVSGPWVVSIEECESKEPEQVYDLTVEPQRCYFANGILVSNSALRTFCEAHSKGMLVGPTAQEIESRRAVKGTTALTGLRGRELHQPKKALIGLRR